MLLAVTVSSNLSWVCCRDYKTKQMVWTETIKSNPFICIIFFFSLKNGTLHYNVDHASLLNTGLVVE